MCTGHVSLAPCNSLPLQSQILRRIPLPLGRFFLFLMRMRSSSSSFQIRVCSFTSSMSSCRPVHAGNAYKGRLIAYTHISRRKNKQASEGTRSRNKYANSHSMAKPKFEFPKYMPPRFSRTMLATCLLTIFQKEHDKRHRKHDRNLLMKCFSLLVNICLFAMAVIALFRAASPVGGACTPTA